MLLAGSRLAVLIGHEAQAPASFPLRMGDVERFQTHRPRHRHEQCPGSLSIPSEPGSLPICSMYAGVEFGLPL
jgi:hypothetical protein